MNSDFTDYAQNARVGAMLYPGTAPSYCINLEQYNQGLIMELQEIFGKSRWPSNN